LNPIRVMIAEDHKSFAETLATALWRQFEIVAMAHTGADLLRLLPASEPDCLLLDHQLPDCDGLDLLPRIRVAAPRLKVIALTQHNLPMLVHRYQQAGAAGFVIKEEPLREIERAIRGVIRGERFHASPGVDHARGARRKALPLRVQRLTPRGLEILAYVGRGMTSAQIAEEIGLSPATVAFHRKAIRRTLGASSEAEVMRYAVETQLFMAEDAGAFSDS
jgi:DNA-binding NarL/FixJ family response regulator